MKNILCFLCSLLFIYISCSTENKYKHVLEEIDTLIQNDKIEDVKKLLNGIDVQDCNREERAYYYLLKTTVSNILEEDVPDSLIDFSISYYEKSTDKNKLVKAYCTKIYSLFDTDKNSDGVYYMKKAETIANSLNDKLLLAQVYATLSSYNLYSNNKLLALEYGKKSLNYAQNAQDKRWMGFAFQNLCFVFSQLNMEDSANFYIEKTLPYITYQLKSQQPYFYNNVALYYYSKDDLKTAKTYLDRSLSIRPTPHAYSLLAEIYSSAGDDDKAEQLWEEALKEQDLRTRYNILESYREWLKDREQYQEVSELTDKLSLFGDSIEKLQNAERIHALQKIYDKEQLERKLWKYVCIIFLFVIFLIILFVCLWYYHRYKLGKSAIKMQQLIKQYEEQIRKFEDAGEKKKKNIQNLKRKINVLQKRQTTLLAKGRHLYDEIIEGKTMNLWNKEKMSAFVEYYSSQQQSFMETIDKYGERLTYTQKVYFALLDMGLDEKRIQKVMCLSEGAFYTMIHRIRKNIGE